MRDVLKFIDRKQLGQRLQIARSAKGLTQQEVADRLMVARTTLTAIEKGERLIRPDELVQLSQLFDEPVNRILRQEINQEPFAVQFRAALAQVDGTEIDQAIYEFQKLCEDYHRLETLTGNPGPEKYPPVYELGRLNPVKRAEDIATVERNRLGLGDSVITNFKKILENEVDIRIFGLPLPSIIAGLFSYSELFGACIATNSKHPKDRQLMSLIHEYGHFLTTRTKADIVVLKTYTRVPVAERFADAFARFFLMPSSDLQRRFHNIKFRKNDIITPADLLSLADFYSVSFQALIFRLENLRLLKSGTWDVLKKRGFKVREAQEMLKITSKIGSNDIELPYRYRMLAVQAFNNDDISEGQLAKFLRTDRVSAREIVDEFVDRDIIFDNGKELPITIDDLSYSISASEDAIAGGNCV